MRQFKDTAGRTWTLALDFAAIKRVRDLTSVDGSPGVNLWRLLDDVRAFREFMADPFRTVDVLFAIVADQAAKLGITDAVFGASLDPDTWEAAVHELARELANFRPERQRKALTRVMDKADQAAKTVAARQEARLLRLEAIPAEEMLDMTEAQLEARLTGKSTPSSSPASSPSTPDPGPSTS